MITEFLEQTSGGAFVTDAAKYEKWKLASRAEVWRLHNGSWSRVYQAEFVPALVLDKTTGLPSYTAADFMGFRSMTVFKDKKGVEAVYAAAGGFSLAFNAPLILRSTDGIHWNTISTPPQMGRETRALGVHNGKLYVGAGGGTTSMFPVPAAVWASDEPDNPLSWAPVLQFGGPSGVDGSNTAVTSFGSYYGRVYVGTENSTGFQVWKSTVAIPASNAQWTKVVTGGAGSALNAWAGTMCVFKSRLYVGSMSVPGVTGSMQPKGFDLIRINSSGSWELIIGDKRTVNGKELKPLSMWGSGFLNPMNLYCWSLRVYKDQLYLGTFDASTFLKIAKDMGADISFPGVPDALVDVLIAGAGADIWKSYDGRYYWPVNLTGLGDPYCYGVRNMVVYNNRLFIGMPNPFFGCEVWKGKTALP
jgi:hypothetical protein